MPICASMLVDSLTPGTVEDEHATQLIRNVQHTGIAEQRTALLRGRVVTRDALDSVDDGVVTSDEVADRLARGGAVVVDAERRGLARRVRLLQIQRDAGYRAADRVRRAGGKHAVHEHVRIERPTELRHSGARRRILELHEAAVATALRNGYGVCEPGIATP